MEPLRARKTNSFGIRGLRQPSSPTHEIIVVSPFKNWRLRDYETALEKWVQSAVDSINDDPHCHVRVVWRRVRFSLVDVFADKGQPDQQLDSAVAKLTVGMTPSSRLARILPRARRDEEGAMLPLIFVTHSIGLWVMEGALDRIDFDRRPVGVIILDGSPNGVVDADFLNRLSGAMNIPMARVDDLVDRFFSKPSVVPGEHPSRANKDKHGSGWSWATKTFAVWVPNEADGQPTSRPLSSFSALQKMLFGRSAAAPSDALKKISLEQAILSVARAETGMTGDVSDVPKTADERSKQTSQPVLIEQGSSLQTNRPSLTPTESDDVVLEVTKTNSPPFHQRWNPPRRRSESGPPRHPTQMPSDISSMDKRSTKGSNSGDDNASIISVPRVYSGESAPMDLMPVLDLAQSFWTIGEFANAQALFERGLHLMRTIDRHDTSELKLDVLTFEMRMRMAVILLYRGKYDEATKGLQDLSGDLKSLPEDDSATATNELKRWVAVSKLYRGNYFKAAEELEALFKGEHKQGKVSQIQILRDLALANGLLGRHENATRYILAAEELSNPRGSTKEDRVKSKWWSIQYTKACLDFFRGEYETALEKVESAFQGLRENLGSTHLKTLRSAALGIQLLAKTGRYREAEIQCRKTMQITNYGLGRMHPLNLETIDGLVYILRSQSRLTEALETAKSLCAMADEALPKMHPQVLRARSQLAATHLAVGNYHTAEKEIRKTVSWAKECLGKKHPETLRYQSELAHVLSYFGDFAEARAIAIATLRNIFSLTQVKGNEPGSNATEEQILDDVLDKIHSPSPTDSFKPHPSLVFTLHVIALIEAKDPSGDLDQAERIMHSVIWCRRTHLGPQHALTLLSEYELASIVRDASDGHRLCYVNDAFYHVWKERRLLFGPSHPETLSAEREVVITDCVRGVWKSGGPARRNQELLNQPTTGRWPDSVDPAATLDPEMMTEHDDDTPPNLTIAQWIDVESVSFAIFTLHESQLGPYHPETLKSLLWVFSIHFLLGKKSKSSTELKETWRNLRARLHHPSVRGERLAEVLRMEERVALNFADEGDYDVGMAVLRDVYGVASTYIQSDVSANDLLEKKRRHHPGLLGVLSAIVEDIEREMRDLEPHAQGPSRRLSTFDPAVSATGARSG